MSFAVRTITALWTSPFLTRPRGAASFTETTMMSPTPAKRRFEPPSTLMHWTRFAPLLSATSRFDCIWIIDPFLLFSSRSGDIGLERGDGAAPLATPRRLFELVGRGLEAQVELLALQVAQRLGELVVGMLGN